MTDIFDTKIVCKKCNEQMQPTEIHREGVSLRAVICPQCEDRIYHPEDLNALDHFRNIRNKTYIVKLRVVGNSHAISIPKEIIEFMNEQHHQASKQMDEMVRLCFEDFGRLSVRFGNEDN